MCKRTGCVRRADTLLPRTEPVKTPARNVCTILCCKHFALREREAVITAPAVGGRYDPFMSAPCRLSELPPWKFHISCSSQRGRRAFRSRSDRNRTLRSSNENGMRGSLRPLPNTVTSQLVVVHCLRPHGECLVHPRAGVEHEGDERVHPLGDEPLRLAREQRRHLLVRQRRQHTLLQLEQRQLQPLDVMP